MSRAGGQVQGETSRGLQREEGFLVRLMPMLADAPPVHHTGSSARTTSRELIGRQDEAVRKLTAKRPLTVSVVLPRVIVQITTLLTASTSYAARALP